jgi:proteic killer suppression protein
VYRVFVIRSFADAATEDLFNGKATKAALAFDRRIWPVIRRKLDMVNAATDLNDLRVPPSNKLHPLKDDQVGRHAIWVNDQYRITFEFKDGSAHKVRCEDYH